MNVSLDTFNAPLASTAAGDLSQRFALDVQGVDHLRHAVRAAPRQGAALVARQFEAMLMHMMLKSMREASASSSAGDGLFDSEHTRYLTSLYDRQLAQHLSSRGIGVADMLQKQLTRHDAAPAMHNPALNIPADRP